MLIKQDFACADASLTAFSNTFPIYIFLITELFSAWDFCLVWNQPHLYGCHDDEVMRPVVGIFVVWSSDMCYTCDCFFFDTGLGLEYPGPRRSSGIRVSLEHETTNTEMQMFASDAFFQSK